MKLNFLVTAVGGDIGQSIIKVLRESESVSRIVGADSNDEGVAKYLIQDFVAVPRADHQDYLLKLEELISSLSIDVLIPCSEAEIYTLRATESIGRARVLKANTKAIEIGFDKLETYKVLKSHRISVPWTCLLEEEPCSLPCIIKPKRGSGNRHIAVVHDHRDVKYFRATRKDCIWQEMLQPSEEEYTCGVFRGSDGTTHTVALRRRLFHDVSGFAQVVQDEEIARLCSAAADAFELRGSMNVQLRRTEKGPRIFEINPRFSSTVYFRHRIGFQDVVWSLNQLFGMPPPSQVKIDVNAKFFRFLSDLVV